MVQIEIRDGIHVLTLAHGKANTLDLDLCRELSRVLDDLGSEARAVLLTGQGRCFCAGVDLLQVRDGGADYVAEFLPALVQCFRSVFDFPRPLVAAINGHAIAGGCVIACAADFRIMTNSAGRIGMAELAVGVPLPASAVEIVRFAARANSMQEMLYMARSLVGTDALAIGLVDSLEEQDSLVDSAWETARSLSEIGPKAFELTKQRLREPVVRMLAQAETHAYDDEVLKAWQSEEVLGAIDRYVNATLGR